MKNNYFLSKLERPIIMKNYKKKILRFYISIIKNTYYKTNSNWVINNTR